MLSLMCVLTIPAIKLMTVAKSGKFGIVIKRSLYIGVVFAIALITTLELESISLTLTQNIVFIFVSLVGIAMSYLLHMFVETKILNN